jgi:hypothetical protein
LVERGEGPAEAEPLTVETGGQGAQHGEA